MNIKEALKTLDPIDDEQWTADGMPRVDVVAKMVENDELKRVEITAAAPDFTRATARKLDLSDNSAPAAPPVAGWNNPPPPGAPLEAPQEHVEVVAEPEVPIAVETAPSDALDPLEALLEERRLLEVEMYEAQAIHKAAKADADAASNQVNDLNRRIEVLENDDPHHSTAHIRAYLNQQKINRLERADRMRKFLGDSGLSLKDVSKEFDPRAPIDRAMHGRKPPRGSVRPMYVRPSAQ